MHSTKVDLSVQSEYVDTRPPTFLYKAQNYEYTNV